MRVSELVRQGLLLPVRWWLRRRTLTPPIDPHTVRRILLLRYDAIGDMIVTTPLIDVLSKHIPHAQIDVVASPRNVSIVRNDPRINAVYVYDGTMRSMLAVRSQCSSTRYDVVISLVMNKTTIAGMGAALWGGRKAIAVTTLHTAREHLYSAWFNVQIALERNVMTMAAMQIELVNTLFGWKIDPMQERISIAISEQQRAEARALQTRPSSALHVMLNVSAGNVYRQWSRERNIALIEELRATFDDVHCTIVTDASRATMANEIASHFTSGVSVLPPCNDFLVVTAALASATVVITPDTSIVHAAASVQRPVVVMYSLKASFLEEWMPHGVPFRAVMTEGRVDLETIEPNRVVAAVKDLLDSTSEAHARSL
jgi:ADP-heptose:LPS heptosyltransferase